MNAKVIQTIVIVGLIGTAMLAAFNAPAAYSDPQEELGESTLEAIAGSGEARNTDLSGIELLDRVTTMNRERPDFEALNELNRAVSKDPVLRQELIRRYKTESDEHLKSVLREALVGSPTPDVVDFSMRLAESGDASQRKDGFELLANLPPSRETYQLAKRAIEKEHYPAVLSRAVAALVPPAITSPAEAQLVVSQLRGLAQHQDPDVRGPSLQMLAYWDKTGKETEDLAYQALSDSAPDVRRAAIRAILGGQLRSEDLKTALMGIVRNSNDDAGIRMGALQALERFALNNDEYAVYSQARAEIEKLQYD